jgi:phosphatidylinositol alpha-1,6-mannosyltransferase
VTAATTAAASGGPRRPRTLLITRNLPPLRGGMERLNLHMALALAEWSDLTVIGPKGCRELLPTVVEVHEVPAGPLRSFLLRSLHAAWRAAREPYDIVIAGSGLTALATQLAAWRSGARAAAYVHGLDLLAPHPLYRALWMPALRRLDLALANSANTARIAAECSVAGGRIDVVHPGVTLPGDGPDSANGFRRAYGLGDRPILLSVGRLTARKGLREFVRESLPEVRRQYPEALLLVIGDEAPDALSGANSGGRAALEALARQLGLAEHVRLLGPCTDDVLSQAYFAADVHVFPVRDLPGDVEGFGMVAIEAAAHGLPTVAFAVGGVPDAVSPGESGYLVSAGGYREFAGAVCRVLEARRDRPMRTSARRFAVSFGWDRFGQRLRDALAAQPRERWQGSKGGRDQTSNRDA